MFFICRPRVCLFFVFSPLHNTLLLICFANILNVQNKHWTLESVLNQEGLGYETALTNGSLGCQEPDQCLILELEP